MNITFEQYANSEFSMIGVSVIIITAPFDQVMNIYSFDMDIELQYYQTITPFSSIPTNFDAYYYLKSLKAKSTNSAWDL